jgi:hydrogenase nickel incorporation protein HypB
MPGHFRCRPVLLTKADFLEFMDDFEPAKAERHVRELANEAPDADALVRLPGGLTSWMDWLRERSPGAQLVSA